MKDQRKRKHVNLEHERPLRVLANHKHDGNVTDAMNACIAKGLRCPNLTPDQVAELTGEANKAASDE